MASPPPHVPLSSTTKGLRGSSGRSVVLNYGTPFGVHVVAPKAPTHDLAWVDVGTSALAMGCWALGFVRSQFRCGAPVERRFEYQGFLLHFVFGARTKLHRTIRVIMPLHGPTADALAVVAACQSCPAMWQKCLCRRLSTPQVATAWCWVGRLL